MQNFIKTRFLSGLSDDRLKLKLF